MPLTTTVSRPYHSYNAVGTNDDAKTSIVHTNGAKLQAKRWEYRYSAESHSMTISPLKETANALDISKTTPLGAARPHREYYPWESMSICATEEATLRTVTPMTCVKGKGPFDLSDALNYGYTAGPTDLVDFFTSHVKKIHDPLYNDWQTCLTCGSTAAIDLALRMFCNRGDWILAEESTYSGTLLAAKSHGLNVVGIKMDDKGLDPEELDWNLRNWDTVKGEKPFVLYTIPSGQNPTGATQPADRKRKVYEIAQKHDLYIIEDDPYYLLNLSQGTSGSHQEDSIQAQDDYIKRLPVSYLSLDTSGRVLRLDSVSKILAPGMRAGWVTGSSQIIELYVAFADLSTLCPSGPTQVLLYQLFLETWGQDGFIAWVMRLSSQYRKRRDVALQACDKYFPSSVCTWNTPDVGMFICLRLNLKHHPLWETQQIKDEEGTEFGQLIEDKISEAAESKGILIAKGSWFTVGHHPDQLFFRLTFAAAPREDLEQAFRKLGDVITSEFRIKP